MLFGNVRVAFLEFLRNLTPQILLFSIALILSTRLDLSHFSWTYDDIVRVLPFAAVLFTFFAAATANTSLFIEKSLTTSEWADKKSTELQQDGLKGFKLLGKLLAAVWKENKAFVVEIVLTFLIVQVGLVVVLISAIPAAANVVHQLNL